VKSVTIINCQATTQQGGGINHILHNRKTSGYNGRVLINVSQGNEQCPKKVI
jgi:hypothetical protein